MVNEVLIDGKDFNVSIWRPDGGKIIIRIFMSVGGQRIFEMPAERRNELSDEMDVLAFEPETKKKVRIKRKK